MVRYYGYYSNVSRGKWKKGEREGLIPSILEPDSSKEYRKSCARLTQKIYGVYPLTSLKCSGKVTIIIMIEDEEFIKKILKWQVFCDIREGLCKVKNVIRYITLAINNHADRYFMQYGE